MNVNRNNIIRAADQRRLWVAPSLRPQPGFCYLALNLIHSYDNIAKNMATARFTETY